MARVLVVDDRPSIVEVLKMLLELKGFAVTTCCDGAEVLNQVRDHRPDVIVLDLILPGKNGLAIMKELKADPNLADIPVIAMTARNEKAAEAELYAYACIMKPFDIHEVAKLVHSAVMDKNLAGTAN